MNCRCGTLLLTILVALGAQACGSPPVREEPRTRSYEITDRSIFVEMDGDRYGLKLWVKGGPVWASPSDFDPSVTIWFEGKETPLPLRRAGSVEVLKGGGVGERKIHLRFSNFPHAGAEGIVLDLIAKLTVGQDELICEIVPVRDPAGRLFGADYPPPLLPPRGEPGYTVLPTMQGILIPHDHPEPLSYSEPWWPDPAPDPTEPWWGGAVYSRACTMAWFGGVAGSQGYLGIIDTPYDATVDLSHPKGGPTRVRVRWRPSRGTLAYTRRVRYTLLREATYVTLARRYREHAKSAGFHRSLEEKMGARPVVGDLKGAILLRAEFPKAEDPLILAQAGRVAQEKRVKRGILQLPREATILSEGSQMAWKGFTVGLREAGWILAPQVDPFGDRERAGARDAEMAAWPSRRGSLGMMVRNKVIRGSSPDERGRLEQPDARATVFTTWYGGYRREGEIVCPTVRKGWLAGSLRRTDGRGIQISGVHLRELTRVPLFDCFHTNHPLDKKGCAGEIRSIMRMISDRGHVVCGDEPTDYAFQGADLFDRCPYPRSGGPSGETRATPIPLVSLVYHDAAVVAWDLDTGSDATDREQFLHAALTGGIAALPLDAEGWLTRRRAGESEKERGARESTLLERARTLSALHERIWKEEMVHHELVSPGGKIQRTRFANGAEVEVNFETGDLKLRGVEPF